jgi:hypothetical protein
MAGHVTHCEGTNLPDAAGALIVGFASGGPHNGADGSVAVAADGPAIHH